MTWQYAIRYKSGVIDALGGDPTVLAELLRRDDELIRREVGEWEVVDHEP